MHIFKVYFDSSHLLFSENYSLLKVSLQHEILLKDSILEYFDDATYYKHILQKYYRNIIILVFYKRCCKTLHNLVTFIIIFQKYCRFSFNPYLFLCIICV